MFTEYYLKNITCYRSLYDLLLFGDIVDTYLLAIVKKNKKRNHLKNLRNKVHHFWVKMQDRDVTYLFGHFAVWAVCLRKYNDRFLGDGLLDEFSRRSHVHFRTHSVELKGLLIELYQSHSLVRKC